MHRETPRNTCTIFTHNKPPLNECVSLDVKRQQPLMALSVHTDVHTHTHRHADTQTHTHSSLLCFFVYLKIENKISDGSI